MPRLLKIMANSFQGAMLRSPWILLIALASFAYLMELARCTSVTKAATKKPIRPIPRFGRIGADNRHDRCQRVFVVAQVDTLRTGVDPEVIVSLQTRLAFRQGNPDFLGGPEECGRFVDDGRARIQVHTRGDAGAGERAIDEDALLIHRRRRVHDDQVHLVGLDRIGGAVRVLGGGDSLIFPVARLALASMQASILYCVTSKPIEPLSWRNPMSSGKLT